MENPAHSPVLLNEAVSALNIQADACIIDGTFGLGGHSRAILNQLGSEGRLLAIDRDPEACRYGEQAFTGESRLRIVTASFEQIDVLLCELNWPPPNGILLDLGISSAQLANPKRGFSFSQAGPLDMRMNTQAQTPSAADWLAQARESEIAQLLREYGEARRARRLARALVQARETNPITTTGQLVKLVSRIMPALPGKHPATKVFLALRSKTNDETGQLQRGLRTALTLLAPSGRLVVISFHSLEDRIVKQFFHEAATAQLPHKLPLKQVEVEKHCKGRVIGRPKRPSATEIARNPRARSAILRVFEKAA